MSARLKAALAHSRLGWRILPCAPGGKRAILTDWPKRATTDPMALERWFGRTPDANVAVATGAASGLLVLDVDGPEGDQALVALERQLGDMPETFPMQWTGTGGGRWQAFFSWPEGRQIGNSVHKLGAGLDTRGAGGYVLVPPSVTAKPYRWAADRDPWTLPLEPAPSWLVDLLDPLDPPTPTPAPWQVWTGFSPAEDRYCLRAVEAELALIVSAPSGRRNDQLNESAYALFRFAAENRLPAQAIAHGLEAAGRHAGLDDQEIERTIASAARARGISL